MNNITCPLFDDPLFGFGSPRPPAPAKPDWPRDDLDFSMHTGSEQFYRMGFMFRAHLMTEGAKDLADKCGAHWLMDIIASYQHKLKSVPFQHWEVQVTHGPPPEKPWRGADGEELEECSNSWAYVTCNNGNGREHVRQLVPYTDFPLRSQKLYACDHGEGGVTVMLPSEY